MLDNNLPTYLLCGVNLATNFPFSSELTRSDSSSELMFRYGTAPLSSSMITPRGQLRYVSPALNVEGKPTFKLFRRQDSDLIFSETVGEFFIAGNEIRVEATKTARLELIESYFLNIVFPYWLESSGVLMLHASAVANDCGAFTFLGLPGAGKSTIAAALVHSGCSLLSDDLLPVDLLDQPEVRPSLPTLRLAEPTALCLLGTTSHLKPVFPNAPKYLVPVGSGGFGTYCVTPQPLKRIYLPHRREPGHPDRTILIEEIPAANAVISLIRHSSLPRISHALGWQKRRFEQLTQLARKVSFRRLTYPHGLDLLPDVCSKLIADFGAGTQIASV